MTCPVAHLHQIWRFPVKSMGGEMPLAAELTPHGLADDRLYAFESTGAPPGMLRVSGAERRVLLLCKAHIEAGKTLVELPGEPILPVDGQGLLDRLTLALPGAHTLRLTLAAKPQTDCRPLALISLQTIAILSAELGVALDPRRFRANFLLDFAAQVDAADGGAAARFPEDALVGRQIQIGSSAVIRVLERDPRCRFITLDPDTAESMPELMKLLHARHGSRAGVYASVVAPGPIVAGDSVRLLP